MSPETGIWASRLEFGPPGWDLSLEVGILASRLESEPRGGRGGFEPCGKEGHRIGHGQWAPKDLCLR